MFFPPLLGDCKFNHYFRNDNKKLKINANARSEDNAKTQRREAENRPPFRRFASSPFCGIPIRRRGVIQLNTTN